MNSFRFSSVEETMWVSRFPFFVLVTLVLVMGSEGILAENLPSADENCCHADSCRTPVAIKHKNAMISGCMCSSREIHFASGPSKRSNNTSVPEFAERYR